MYEKEIAYRLQEARKKAGLTQQEVLEPLGIASVQSLSSYETGKTAPPLDKLKDMATLYKVSSDWLLFGNNKPAETKTRNDHILQLAEAIDTLKLRIVVSDYTTSYGSDGKKYLVQLADTHDLLAECIPLLFASRWEKFRSLLDGKDIDQWAYDSLMAKLEEELVAGNLEDEDLLPF